MSSEVSTAQTEPAPDCIAKDGRLPRRHPGHHDPDGGELAQRYLETVRELRLIAADDPLRDHYLNELNRIDRRLQALTATQLRSLITDLTPILTNT